MTVRRPLLTLSACALLATACAPLPNAPGAAPDRPVTTFTYRADTPRVQRAFDANECELVGRGLPPTASDEEIAAASNAIPLEQRRPIIQDCLRTRGYTVTDMPVCLESDYSRGSLVIRPNVLPPFDSIVCLDPNRGGIVTTQPPAAA